MPSRSSEIFVVSTNSVNARSVTTYQNMLAKDAFTNFATIMKDVSLSPAMGGYLNMLNSNKPATGQIANENYPRELMQLFTTGIDTLNPDGTLQLDSSGNPIPVYTETQVQAFARAYTGWTYANSTGGASTKFPNGTANYDFPMAAVESAHDTTAKILLNGTTLPAGQTAEQDLAGALANIFAHSNVGPFVCRQLIQHLVDQQSQPCLRRPHLRRLRQQRQRRPRRHAGRHSRHPRRPGSPRRRHQPASTAATSASPCST